MPRLITRIIMTTLLAAITAVPVALADSRSTSLERALVSKDRQVVLLDRAIDFDEQQLHFELADPETMPETLASRYHQLKVLLDISIANPYEERMIYNEIFHLQDKVEGLYTRFAALSADNDGHLNILQDTMTQLELLAEGSHPPGLMGTIQQLKKDMAGLKARFNGFRDLIRPRLVELQRLKAEMAVSISVIRRWTPKVFKSYVAPLRPSLFEPLFWKKMPVYFQFWFNGQPAQALAKMPEDGQQWLFLLAAVLACWLPLVLLGNKILKGIPVQHFNDHETSRATFTRVRDIAALSVAFLAGSITQDFPAGTMTCQLGLTLGFLAAMKIAWGLRVIRFGRMPASPLYPLFWMFVLGTALQFINLPLIVISVLWPMGLIAVFVALFVHRKRIYPLFERRLITLSLLFMTFTFLLCLVSRVYLSVLLTMGWFLTAVCIQLGSAVGRLLNDQARQWFKDEDGKGRGIFLSLATPLLWIALLVAVLVWTANQFSQVALFLKQYITANEISALITVLFMILAIRLMTALETAYSTYHSPGKRPLKGFFQITKLFVLVIGLVTAGCLLANRSPWAVLGGIGAITAAVILVFKDTILAVVAGVRIAVDDLVRIGDWIEIGDMGVDGDVLDISLHSVKIRNFDQNIVTIPATTLIDHSFKNWRGMAESGGRRIKRSIPIDLSSIFYLNQAWIQRLKNIDLLKPWIDQCEQQGHAARSDLGPSSPELLNSDRLTNLGAFRAYVTVWLRSHENVHQGLTFLIRHLEPVADQGLPFQIYVFANDTAWTSYEHIQANIFDHLLAALPVFGLKVYQRNALPDKRPVDMEVGS